MRSRFSAPLWHISLAEVGLASVAAGSALFQMSRAPGRFAPTGAVETGHLAFAAAGFLIALYLLGEALLSRRHFALLAAGGFFFARAVMAWFDPPVRPWLDTSLTLLYVGAGITALAGYYSGEAVSRRC